MINKFLHNFKTIAIATLIFLIVASSLTYYAFSNKVNNDVMPNTILLPSPTVLSTPSQTPNINQKSSYQRGSSLQMDDVITTSIPITTPAQTLEQTNSQQIKTPIATPNSTQTSIYRPTLTPIPKPSQTPTPTSSAIPKTRVVGYYAFWAAKSGYTPDKIDGNKFTHINYAFANIGDDLKIAYADESVDISNFNAFRQLKKKYPHLKTLISIGGWTWSGKFSDVVLTEASRTIFADSCIDFVVKNGFDGIDIDWESPVSGGLPTNVKRPEDKQNFTNLIQKLREKLNAKGLTENKSYLLTIAGAADTVYIRNTEISVIYNYLDYINLMTYDLHGPWDMYTDFNAPLYADSDNSPQGKGSVDSAVKAWLNSGCPAQKLVIGMPFYGYKYSSVNIDNNGLYQTYAGGYNVDYSIIAEKYLNAPGYTRFYAPQSMVPWLFNGTTFITYEDEQSIALKAQYIKSNGLGGAMIWELSQDPNGVLLNSLINGLR